MGLIAEHPGWGSGCFGLLQMAQRGRSQCHKCPHTHIPLSGISVMGGRMVAWPQLTVPHRLLRGSTSVLRGLPGEETAPKRDLGGFFGSARVDVEEPSDVL